MTEDMYLSLAIELYEKGTWSKEVFIKRITLYAKEKNMEMAIIDEIINRLIKPKEYTIEEKRRFLSFITIAGDELKYGDAVLEMSDEMVEKFYQMEKESLANFDELHKMDDSKVVKKEITNETTKNEKHDVIEEIIPEFSYQEENVVIDNNAKIFEDNIDALKEEKVDETNLSFMDEIVESFDNNSISKNQEDKLENIEGVKEPILVVPELSFGEDDFPKTEEEFEKQAENITKSEKDSTVRKVEVSPERLAKLKKTKDKAINCFLKTGMVILAVKLLNPVIAIGTVVGYMYFAEEIKCGTFNPTNLIGKAVKYAVEKVMNIGMNKENERGKAK